MTSTTVKKVKYQQPSLYTIIDSGRYSYATHTKESYLTEEGIVLNKRGYDSNESTTIMVKHESWLEKLFK